MVAVECGLSNGVVAFASWLFNFSYTWLTAFYFFLGIFGNVTLLIAFYKQSREDGAYVYQVYLTVSKTLEVLATSTFNILHNTCSGPDVPGYQWYMRNYFGMFLSAHILCPLSNWFMVSSLFCNVAMTADRVFALAKPFVYKNINHARHQKIAGVTCFGLSFLINLYDCWHWYVQLPLQDQPFYAYPILAWHHPNDTYLVVPNEQYLESPQGVGLSYLRTALRLTAVLVLVVLNVRMVVMYRKHNTAVSTINEGNDRKLRAKKSSERSLMILTVSQSMLTLLANVPHSLHFIAIFTWFTYTECYITIFGPIVDDLIMISDAADFFVIISVNKRMRRMILKIFPGHCAGPVVSQLSVSNSRVAARSEASALTPAM